MAAELLAQGGVDLGGERLVLSRGEPREERECDGRDRNRALDRLVHRPAPLARVLDVTANLVERRVVRERGLEQLEQPASDDRPVLPERRELTQVELEVRNPVEELEALGIGLHEA